MHVEDSLPGPRLAIENTAVAGSRISALGRDGRASADHRADETFVARTQIAHRRDVLTRHHEDVHRGLGVDVVEGDEAIIFENFRGGNLTGHDLTEKARHKGMIA